MIKSHTKKAALIGGTVFILAGLIACGRPFAGKDRSDYFLKGMDRKVASLDLNAEQQAYYDRIRAEMKADLEALKKGRKETAGKIKAELIAAAPDMNMVSAFAKEEMQKHLKLFEKQIDRLTEFYSQLNAEQQKEVREFIDKRLSRFDS